jgi:hypothetical protein
LQSLQPDRWKMRILTDCSFLSKKQIEKIEQHYGAKYVFESQIKLRSNKWSYFSAAVFYTETPHPEGSNWFGVWESSGRYMISNAASAVDEQFFGIMADNKDVIYPPHPHDFRRSDDKSVFVSGGRDNTVDDLTHHVIKLTVHKDEVVVYTTEQKKTFCDVPYTSEMDVDLSEV